VHADRFLCHPSCASLSKLFDLSWLSLRITRVTASRTPGSQRAHSRKCLAQATSENVGHKAMTVQAGVPREPSVHRARGQPACCGLVPVPLQLDLMQASSF
jgi:hypothetical protein